MKSLPKFLIRMGITTISLLAGLYIFLIVINYLALYFPQNEFAITVGAAFAIGVFVVNSIALALWTFFE